ncbi:MAG: hypothetical protein K2L78_07865 [Muribaculaceae bacterium]|nr:hypothetical protein [Muribaculaceae bacterium]
MTLRLTAALFAGLMMLTGCADRAEEPRVPEPDMAVFVDGDELYVSPEGGDVVLRIKANTAWVLEIPGHREYLNGELHARKGGAGETDVVFTAFPNVGDAARTTTFKLTGGRAEPSTITLRQDAVGFELPSEDEVRAYLMRLFDATDGPNWRFKGKWGSDLPLSQWGAEVKYENGRLELNLTEHYLKGKIDLSGCKALVRLRCAKNMITEVDVSDCPLLEYVDATNSGVERVNVKGCYALRELLLGYNSLADIDVGWSTTLEYLRVENNALRMLDLSRCVSIERIACNGNRLVTLEIPYRQNLRSLWCYENELCSLNVSDSPWLVMLNCGDNALEHLNVKGCVRLSSLWCYANRLTEIDCSDSRETLGAYYCFSNKLRKVDVSGFRKLHELHCSDNNISSINIDGCVGLGWLYCAYNQLDNIDLSSVNPREMARIDVTGNRLLAIDLTPFKSLFHLWCKGTRTGGEIPVEFDRFEDFEYDARYEYLDSPGEYIDHGYGWWYPGEPAKGSHTR